MKTKELIKQLQEADPSGELDCNCNGADIYFVQHEYGYYDGPYERLKRDDSKACYNVTGAEITTAGEKVIIHTLSIEDALCNDTELPVTVTHYNRDRMAEYLDTVEKWRQEARDSYRRVNMMCFAQFVKKEFGLEREIADAFYARNIHYKDEIDADIKATKSSPWQKNHEMWKRNITAVNGLLKKVG